MDAMKKALLYARVSTTRQAERDLSIPDQLRQLHAYCKLHDYQIIKEYKEEGASATDDNRPVFKEMVADIDNGLVDVSVILVLTTSRFFRNAVDAGIWKRRFLRHGIRVIAIHQETGDPLMPTTNLIETIFAAIDEHESKMIGFHTGRGMRENARRGFFNGSKAPFGYKVVKTTDERGNTKGVLEVDAEEAEVVKRIFELHVVENLGALEIAKKLNMGSGTARYGKNWTRNYVFRILENPVCIGSYYFNQYDSRNKRMRPESEWIMIPVDPIITPEVFESAAALRKTRTPHKSPGRAESSPFILAGLFKCGKCGSSMVATTGKNGRYHYYSCAKAVRQGKGSCSGHRVPVDKIEDFVVRHVIDWAFSEKNIKNLMRDIRRNAAEAKKPVREMKTKLAEVNAKLKKYFDTFENGKYDPALFADRIAELKAEKTQIEVELQRHSVHAELPPGLSTPENLKMIQGSLKEIFLTASPGLKKRYLRLLLKEIVIDGEEIVLTGAASGTLALLETTQNKKSTPDVSEVLHTESKWRTRRESNPQPLGP